MSERKSSKARGTKAGKQVLITINRDGMEAWSHFEAYCKKYSINKSGLIRQLVNAFLKEQAGMSETHSPNMGRYIG